MCVCVCLLEMARVGATFLLLGTTESHACLMLSDPDRRNSGMRAHTLQYCIRMTLHKRAARLIFAARAPKCNRVRAKSRPPSRQTSETLIRTPVNALAHAPLMSGRKTTARDRAGVLGARECVFCK